MLLKGRVAILVCAAALAAVPLPARSANTVAFAVDRQGATGVLSGPNGSYASLDGPAGVYGENFRAVVFQPPTVAVSTRSYGCVTFNGQTATVSACGNNFTVTITGVLGSAQIVGSASNGPYTIQVNMTVTATDDPVVYPPTAIVGLGCSPALPTISVPPTPSIPPSPSPSAVPTRTPAPLPTVSPSPLPTISPSPPSTPVPLPTVSPRTCFVDANPGVQRDGHTSGSVTLFAGGNQKEKVQTPDAGTIYAEALAELDVYSP